MTGNHCTMCPKGTVERAGDPIRTGGQTYWPVRCTTCGFFESRLRNPFPPVKVHNPAAEQYVADAEAQAEFPPTAVTGLDLPQELRDQEMRAMPAEAATDAPAPTIIERIVREADGFSPARVKVGDVVVFMRGGQEQRLKVVSVAAKSMLGDVDGQPDFRVQRKKLIGKVVVE